MNSLSAEHRDDYIDALQDDILVAKRSKLQIKEAARTDNCIDALPDDILVAILSKVRFREAVRTSVLSRRWRSVWKFLSCLDFDGTENMKQIYSRSNVEAARRKYINWVNQILEYSYLESSTVEELRIAFNLGENHTNEIDKWIRFAMAKRVKSLKLDFSTLWGYKSSSLYTFQDSLLQLPCIISGFGSLTVLSLKSVDVSGDTVACILSNSPLLETFTLQKARSLLSLVVKGPSVLKLKHLKIVECFKLTTIEISAENLVSFKYRGTPIDISYRNLPLLSEFLIGGSYAAHWIYELDQLSYYLSQLHTLTLNLCYVREFYSFPAKFPEFINLKHLELRFLDFDDARLAFIVFLLEATPYLCSLMVKAHFPTLAIYDYHLIPSKSACVIGNLRSYQRVERRAHKYLKVIELVGWTVKETDVKLATYLLEIAVSLDKIIIDPCFNYYTKKRTFGERLLTEGRKEVVREHARRQLGSKLPLGAKLLTR